MSTRSVLSGPMFQAGIQLLLASLMIAGSAGAARAAVSTPLGVTIPGIAGTLGSGVQVTVPKVPFSNKPCESLTPADLTSLGLQKITAKPDRAPSTLPIDNYCSYLSNSLEAQVGYMTKDDYDMNQDGNRSTSHTAPADLPGAFYDRQGGLWFAKNGYYVVIAGRDAYKEKVAHIVASKL